MKYYCVFDTNVIISYFLNKSKESSIYKLIVDNLLNEHNIVPVINRKIINEYLDVLKRDRFDNKIDRNKAIDFISFLNDESINIESENDYISILSKEQKKRMVD